MSTPADRTPAGAADATSADATTSDGTAADAGPADATAADAGPADAGPADGPAASAGPMDGLAAPADGTTTPADVIAEPPAEAGTRDRAGRLPAGIPAARGAPAEAGRSPRSTRPPTATGAVTDGLPATDPPPWRFRGVLYVAGLAMALVGAHDFLRDRHHWLMPSEWARWLVAGALLHDLVLVPVVIVGGLGLARLVPGRYRAYVQAGLVVSAVTVAATLPQLLGRRTETANTTLQPRDYPRGIGIVLGVVWLSVALLAVLRGRQRQTQPDGGVGTPNDI